MQSSLACVFLISTHIICLWLQWAEPCLKKWRIIYYISTSISNPYGESHYENQCVWQGLTGKKWKRTVPYRFLCSHAQCQWALDWSSPCWRGMSCVLTWCCFGPIIWLRALATWYRLSPCLDLSPHWLSSRGVATPGQSCTWQHGMEEPLQSQGFEGKSLLLKKANNYLYSSQQRMAVWWAVLKKWQKNHKK